jgi:hypothetical protein
VARGSDRHPRWASEGAKTTTEAPIQAAILGVSRLARFRVMDDLVWAAEFGAGFAKQQSASQRSQALVSSLSFTEPLIGVSFRARRRTAAGARRLVRGLGGAWGDRGAAMACAGAGMSRGVELVETMLMNAPLLLSVPSARPPVCVCKEHRPRPHMATHLALAHDLLVRAFRVAVSPPRRRP